MKKYLCLLVFGVLLLGLAGCSPLKDVTKDTVYVHKNGKISQAIVEEFSQSYYDANELHTMADEEAEKYNQTNGDNCVKVKSFEMKENVISLFMEYKAAKDYQDFNATTFYAGTVEAAYDQGFAFENMINTDTNETISPEDVLALGNENIVIFVENENVIVNQNIKYISSNLVLENEKEVSVKTDEGIHYIIY